MKHLLIILFLTFNCSAQKAEYDVINDFLKTELLGHSYDTIHVRVEPLPLLEMIKLYEKAYIERNNENLNSATVWVTPKIKKWPFIDKDINEIKDNTTSDKWKWMIEGFSAKNLVVKDSTITDIRGFQLSHMNTGKKEYTLKLSKPVFSKNKKYAIFLVYFNELLLRGNPFPHSGLVIMKKEKNRWTLFSNINEVVYN